MKNLKNAWYMAGWSLEVGQGLLRRRLCDNPVVLYRLENGSVAALEDRCPHRFAPLSLGVREGDSIQCAYHGLTFSAQGECIRNPYGPKIPNGASVRSFPTYERYGIVWMWAGQPELANTGTIPNFDAVFEGQEAPPLRGYTEMKANFEYGTDNLMDLSHIEFVHKGSFAGAGVIFAGQHSVREEGEVIHSNWWMPGVLAPGHTFGIYPRDMKTDHWLDMRWNAPATMLLEIGATPCGAPRAEGVIVQQAHILTPASEGLTHYFWATTRTSQMATEEGDAMLRSLFKQAFDTEDKPMIEAAYENTDGADFWERKPAFLGIDAGGTRARRMLQKMIASETAAPAVAVT
jgi:phenylpropionate dioxygenase-like ring-hydroxylating dioxygenase large terminal subunit